MRCLLPNTHAYKRLNGSYILNIGYDYLIVPRLQSTMLGILGLTAKIGIHHTRYYVQINVYTYVYTQYTCIYVTGYIGIPKQEKMT